MKLSLAKENKQRSFLQVGAFDPLPDREVEPEAALKMTIKRRGAETATP